MTRHLPARELQLFFGKAAATYVRATVGRGGQQERFIRVPAIHRSGSREQGRVPHSLACISLFRRRCTFPNMRSGGASPESRLQSASQHNHHHLAPLIEYGWALRGLTISYCTGHTSCPIHRSVHGRGDGDTILHGSRLGVSTSNNNNCNNCNNCNFGNASRRCLDGAS